MFVFLLLVLEACSVLLTGGEFEGRHSSGIDILKPYKSVTFVVNSLLKKLIWI